MPFFSDDKMYETAEEMFDAWDAKHKKEHPIKYWLKHHIFPNIRIADYSAFYALTHPWVIASYAGRQVKWAWQRVFRGWDDRVTWSIDCHLDTYLPVWLERLIKTKQGVPNYMFKDTDYNPDSKNYELKEGMMELRGKEYDAILQKIADGFRAHLLMEEVVYDSPEYHEYEKQFNDAWDLLKEHYGSLWD